MPTQLLERPVESSDAVPFADGGFHEPPLPPEVHTTYGDENFDPSRLLQYVKAATALSLAAVSCVIGAGIYKSEGTPLAVEIPSKAVVTSVAIGSLVVGARNLWRARHGTQV